PSLTIIQVRRQAGDEGPWAASPEETFRRGGDRDGTGGRSMVIRWSRWSPQLALLPALAITLVAFVGAILWTIFLSFTRSRRFPEYLIDWSDWGRQYERLFKDDGWQTALKNLVILGLGSFLAIVFGFIL